MKAVTANRLSDGEVVFWNAGRWVDRFAEAELFTDDATADQAVELAAQPTVVVEPYLIEIVEENQSFAPLSYRERLRALGPTNHPQHGKQADGGADIAALNAAHGAARSVGRVNLIKLKK